MGRAGDRRGIRKQDILFVIAVSLSTMTFLIDQQQAAITPGCFVSVPTTVCTSFSFGGPDCGCAGEPVCDCLLPASPETCDEDVAEEPVDCGPPDSGTPTGGGGSGGGGGGGSSPPPDPLDKDDDGKIDCWQDVPITNHPSSRTLDQGQEVASQFQGTAGPCARDNRRGHAGIDIDCYEGDSVRAPMDGTVGKVGWLDDSRGYCIEIIGPGDQERSRVCELIEKSETVQPEQSVQVGDVIAQCGQSSPNATSPHVHLETWAKDGDGEFQVKCPNSSRFFGDCS